MNQTEFQQHKKEQAKMKDTFNEMKTNLQGNNSRVNKAKNHISNLECKTQKHLIRTARRKQEFFLTTSTV